MLTSRIALTAGALTVLAACAPHGRAEAVAPASAPALAPVPAPPPCVAPAASRLTFRVAYQGGSDASAVEGRLLVAMTSLAGADNPFEMGFSHMRDEWLAAAQVGRLKPGESVTIDPDSFAWPRRFSLAPAGTYRIAARLVRAGRDDLTGEVVEKKLDPANAGTIDLRLTSSAGHGSPPPDTDGVKLVTYPSRLLSEFYGRPMTLQAVVTLPAEYRDGGTARKYATEYYIRGFGASISEAARGAVSDRRKRIEAGYPPMVRVILTGMIPTGHHVFADSVNDGPWGRALVEELIPEIERRFAVISGPRGRFLSGQSSGGWSALWLQINHPDFFGGAWAFAPDPVDFRKFLTIDVTPGSHDNAFVTADKAPRVIMRADPRDAVSFEEFVRAEDVGGEVGALGTFNWVFSPRGPRGEPVELFDRATGEQNPEVQRAWAKYDIHRVLEAGWATLSPKLRGKLHLFVGAEDTFYLNESVTLLCDFLKSKKSDAVCDLVADRGHFDLQGDVGDPKSLVWRAEHEMAAAAGAK